MTGSTAEYTFVLKLTDRPGAMELIAATFSHRGISIITTLGNDGNLDPDGHATVLVHFRTTPARKAALEQTLRRLSRVVGLTEHTRQDTALRQSALVRLASDAPLPAAAHVVVETVATDPQTGETIYAVAGHPADVSPLLTSLRDAGCLRAVTQTTLAL